MSSSTARSLSSVRGGFVVAPPAFAVVSPGISQLNENWQGCKLLAKDQLSHDTSVFTFECPDTSKALNLPTCGCLLVSGGADKTSNEPIVRPYTPISTNNMIGKFELMVKIYPDGNMSQHIDSLSIGDTLNFKHIGPNVKKQYPFGAKKIGMIVGGTGITPMIQALHAILGNPADDTQVSVLYGSRTEQDILGIDVLNEWEKSHPKQLSVTHVLSEEPEGSSWKGARGHITKDLISKHLPSELDDCLNFVCGPPIMYDIFCGPRTEAEVTGVLGEMGYSDSQVYKF